MSQMSSKDPISLGQNPIRRTKDKKTIKA